MENREYIESDLYRVALLAFAEYLVLPPARFPVELMKYCLKLRADENIELGDLYKICFQAKSDLQGRLNEFKEKLINEINEESRNGLVSFMTDAIADIDAGVDDYGNDE